jgi:hypothetical protein
MTRALTQAEFEANKQAQLERENRQLMDIILDSHQPVKQDGHTIENVPYLRSHSTHHTVRALASRCRARPPSFTGG